MIPLSQKYFRNLCKKIMYHVKTKWLLFDDIWYVELYRPQSHWKLNLLILMFPTST